MLGGQLECWKEVVGECGPDYVVEPGESITWELHLRNPSPTARTLQLTDSLAHLGEVLLDANFTDDGGVDGVTWNGTISGFEYTGEVEIRAGGSGVLTVTAEVSPDLACVSHVTNCAELYEIATETSGELAAERCAPKTVVSPTIVVVPEGKDANDAKFCPGSDGRRSININEILYCLLGNECDAQKVMDLIVNEGFSFGSIADDLAEPTGETDPGV